MSEQITDAKALLNVMNLVDASTHKLSAPAHRAFAKLFALVGVPLEQLALLEQNLLLATALSSDPGVPLLPQRVQELTWLGLAPASLHWLKPYVTVLPEATPLNLNSASAEVIYANFPQLELSDARRLVQQRQGNAIPNLNEVERRVGSITGAAPYDVSTSYFEVHARLRLDSAVVEEVALVQRVGQQDPITLWRQRGVSESLVGSADPTIPSNP